MKIKSKLLVILVASMLLALSGLGTYAGHLLSRAVRDSTMHRLQQEAAYLAEDLPPDRSAASLQRFTRRAAKDLGVRITLIDPRGVVLADSEVEDGEVAKMENHLKRPEVQEALGGSLGASGGTIRRSATTGLEYFYFAKQVQATQGVRFLRIALPREDLESFGFQYLLLLLLAVALVLVAFGFGAWIVVGRLARPVERITAVAERVAAGELAVEVPEEGEDEVRRLGVSVNRMKESLVSQLSTLDAERALLRTMTDGLQEGLLLVDCDRRILLANQELRDLFRLRGDLHGQKLTETIDHEVILAEVDACLSTGEDRNQVVKGPIGTNRSFDLQVAPVSIPHQDGAPGALVTLFDITRMEALEKMRQRFIADVSHELRTPVTSIKGAVETILDGDTPFDEDTIRFLEMARRQADRMRDLIEDLTDLSRIETGSISLDPDAVLLAPIVRNVFEAMSSRYGQESPGLVASIDSEHQVTADSRRLEQILVNLIDNAVKFTPPDGQVTVSASHHEGFTRIEVADQGPGIPSKSLPRVFTRFYRVDKARSRQLGGTGLGLAIVKHLVVLHHGSIRVESEVGHGARFILELPD